MCEVLRKYPSVTCGDSSAQGTPFGCPKGEPRNTNLQTPYEIKLTACTGKHLNINITDTGKGNNRRWQAPGGQRGQRAIPPDGFDMAALENCCPQASSRGDVGVLPTYFKGGSSVLTISPKMNKSHREIKVDFDLYTKSCDFSVASITLCHEIFRFFSVFQPETLLRVAFVNF